jgi:HlyD family secretion protein
MEKETLDEKKKVPNDVFNSTVNITPSKIRYFTIGVLILLSVILVWGVFGSIMVKMKAFGIITTKLSIYSESSDFGGIVNTIYKTRGDTVKKGDKLIKLSQIELNLQLKDQLFLLTQQIIVDSIQMESLENQKKISINNLKLQIEDLQSTKKQSEFEIDFYVKMIDESKILLKKGIMSNTDYNQTLFQLQKLRLSFTSDSSNLISLVASKKTYLDQVKLEKQQIISSIKELKEQTNNLKIKYDTSSYIYASSEGIIQECLVKTGMPVAQFQDVFTIREINIADTRLYADLFIPYFDMEKAAINMKAVISPYNIDQNRYGKIESTISEISYYPASKTYMYNLLGNQDIVDAFSSNGPVYYSRAILTTDLSTVSGLKWTSAKGPPFTVNAGMSCSADIIVDSRPPISFVIPWFKKVFKDE